MTTFSNAILSLPAPSITLALGGLTTSYVFFGNLAEYQRGVIPYLNGRLLPGSPLKLTDKEKAKLWRAYFKPAATWVVGASLVSSVLAFTTSYIHPSPLISRITLISGIQSLAILPITALSGLLPINSRLLELAENESATSVKEDEAKELINSWETRHLRRMPAYALACLSTLMAIVLDGRV
ncbi:uncharacterized protein I303_108705 [Kwoniella dejecticola CBS 10117]|uniref:DUF1772-domain-containing protein n=1 Tax=Kwoniella dejecticola CBS 10117 TaxID=1296121 RepID=A0A1A5ZWM7_9TREE|nr:uncharacterized protein I303_06970 [Kwoniella dejecticola CBS 10117]OBR82211.1 hypothetical protein I303_06970 [Kwoniella dejecticola CBS 10117]